MLRKKEIVLVSHCVLNQNSVVYPLGRAEGAFKLINCLIDSGIGIIQLPCPELRHLGINRKSMCKEEYDTKEYRDLCTQLFMPILKDIIAYYENGYSILGIIGIHESPSCSITGKRGVFMEEIFRLLKLQDIQLKYFEVPSEYNDITDHEALSLSLTQRFNIY